MNKLLHLSLIASCCLVTAGFSDEIVDVNNSEVTKKIAVKAKKIKKITLEERVRILEEKLAASEAKVEELSGDSVKIDKMNKTLSEVKKHDSGDNIKWGVDLRTAMDSLNYKMVNGDKYSKNALLSTRLILNMKFAADDNNIFKGVLAYNKAFGADFNFDNGSGMDRSDWVTNEALTNNNLKVKEAYWLYMGDSMGEANIPWTMSIGRRPATDGMLANLREGNNEYKSPLAHMINVEFDGASTSANVENVVGIPGAAVKLCVGKGSTDAAPMFSGATNYTDNNPTLDDIRMLTFIITPYDNGQVTSKIQLYRAWNVPGLKNIESPTDGFKNVGNIDGYTWSTLVNGIGEDGILSETKLFASLAMSKTNPDGGEQMLGSSDSKTGTSCWVGAQVPVLGGKFGAEYNHGSKYWRPFTYGEDTMAGSKLAVRGDAYEAYYIYPLTKALTAEARYTYMDYKYNGSNSFFGNEGNPMSTVAMIDKASDLRFSVQYSY